MGGGGSADRSAAEAAQAQSQLAMRLINQTDPLRQGLINRSQQFLSGGVDRSPQFAAYKANAEPLYASARESIIGDTPAGGALTSALTDLETGKARDFSVARGAIDESELSRALTLGTGTVNPAMGGLSSAASIQSQRAQASAERDASVYGALGGGLGAFFGGGGFGDK